MIGIVLGCVWLVTANVLAMLPSRDNHWARAYVLMAVGIPLLIYIGYENNLFIALMFLIGAASILRWPVVYLTRWMRRTVGKVAGGLGKDQGPE